MQQRDKLIAGTVSGILALGAAAVANAVPDQPEKWEKCAGVAKAGMNDCGALDGSHDCAGMAKQSSDEDEWVYVPAGTCEKLVGGTVAASVPAKDAEEK